MNITITIPDESVPAWQARVDKYNAGSGQSPVTIEQFCQLNMDTDTARHVAAKADDDKAMLAANAVLVAIGLQVASAPPDKQAAAIAAAQAALA